MSISTWGPETIKEFISTLPRVKNKLTSPESALLLRELFYEKFAPPTTNTPDVYFFVSVIKRPEESLDDFTGYKAVIEEYHKVGIKKYFGLTITEYLDLTHYEKYILCDQAAGFAEEELRIAKEAAQDSHNEIKSLQDPDFAALLGEEI